MQPLLTAHPRLRTDPLRQTFDGVAGRADGE
jgi:hypothetical protein